VYCWERLAEGLFELRKVLQGETALSVADAADERLLDSHQGAYFFQGHALIVKMAHYECRNR